MVLTHPVDSKTVHRGDDIYAQLTAPIAISDQVVIPAGTFVQGQVEKLSRQGSRGEFAMRSLSLMFANGYVANVNGTTTIESEEGTAWSNPGTGAKVGLFAAPFAGLGLGAAIGSAAHTTETIPWGTGTRTISNLKGVAIGSMVGLAAGGATSLVLLARSHQFFVDVGSPMQVTLAQPLTLQAARVQEALRKTQSVQPITPVAPRPVIIAPSASDNGTCYTPGSPGTPPTVIPGIPATPNSPGTPDVVIPGTPASPPIPHPCP
jgi:type IV secretion system protein VirB10